MTTFQSFKKIILQKRRLILTLLALYPILMQIFILQTTNLISSNLTGFGFEQHHFLLLGLLSLDMALFLDLAFVFCQQRSPLAKKLMRLGCLFLAIGPIIPYGYLSWGAVLSDLHLWISAAGFLLFYAGLNLNALYLMRLPNLSGAAGLLNLIAFAAIVTAAFCSSISLLSQLIWMDGVLIIGLLKKALAFNRSAPHQS